MQENAKVLCANAKGKNKINLYPLSVLHTDKDVFSQLETLQISFSDQGKEGKTQYKQQAAEMEMFCLQHDKDGGKVFLLICNDGCFCASALSNK